MCLRYPVVFVVCNCTGNKGFYKQLDRFRSDGTLEKKGYSYPKDLGERCGVHADFGLTTGWAVFVAQNEPFCYIPCDKSICAEVPRHPSHMLWAATEAGVPLCYSFEACGGKDYVSKFEASCLARGGYLGERGCSCDIGEVCTPKEECKGIAVSGALDTNIWLNGCFKVRDRKYVSGYDSYVNEHGCLLYYWEGANGGSWNFGTAVGTDIRARAYGEALSGPGVSAIAADAWRSNNSRGEAQWEPIKLRIINPPEYSGTHVCAVDWHTVGIISTITTF